MAKLIWDELSTEVENSRLKLYRKGYFTSMIKSGKDLEECGRLESAGLLYAKVREELSKQSARMELNFEHTVLDFRRAGLGITSNAYEELNTAYKKYQDLFPRQEQIFFDVKLKEIHEAFREEKENINSALPSQRKKAGRSLAYIRRLRAQIYKSLSRHAANFNPGNRKRWDIEISEGTGCYNALFNAREIVDLISNSDSVWVEEFLEHYKSFNRLLRLFN